MEVKIKSFNGIGDLLFVTPTIRRIKEKYGKGAKVIVNTNHPVLVKTNPYVDIVNESRDGVFLGYADPIHCVNPTKHHIVADWEIVSKEYNLDLKPPKLHPEIYLRGINRKKSRRHGVAVQVTHKGHWDNKKVWPFFEELCWRDNRCEPVPMCDGVDGLVRHLSTYQAVVCAEGGLSHIAKAIGLPAIVIYGGFAKPEWNGYEEHVNICRPLECSYCYHPKPCVHEIQRACMKSISVGEVIGEIDKLLG
jgi:ADP-heptose:LPS heptosyltransferase